MHTHPQQIREHHLNKAQLCAQKADLLEAEGEAKHRAKCPDIAQEGKSLLTYGAQLRRRAQLHLRHVTNLTDYSEPSDRPDTHWLHELQRQAAVAAQGNLYPSQVSSVTRAEARNYSW